MPPDPALPQLETIWDAAAMAPRLQAALAAGAAPWRCRVHRLRYRPRARSVVLYEVEAAGAEERWWVSGAVWADGRSRAVYRRVADRIRRRGLAVHTEPLVPAAHLADLDLLVQVFPIDRRLPALPSLLDAARGAGMGRRLVRYRPHLGATVALTEGGGDVAFAKVYPSDAAATEAITRLRVAAEVASGGAFRVPRILSTHTGGSVVTTMPAAGAALVALLARGGGGASAMQAVARALAALHHAPRPRSGMPVAPASATAAPVADKIAWALPDTAAALRDIRRAATQSRPLRLAHLDLKPEHVFVTGEEVTFIDADSMGIGDPMFDVATMQVRLRMLADDGRVDPRAVPGLGQALLGEYRRLVPCAWAGDGNSGYAVAALKAALYHVQRLEPGWQYRARRWVHRAHARCRGPQAA